MTVHTGRNAPRQGTFPPTLQERKDSMSRMKVAVPLLLMVGTGMALAVAKSVKLARKASATETARRTRLPKTEPIRPAGAESMQTPPKRWDIVDEQSDASFPASDPPGNY